MKDELESLELLTDDPEDEEERNEAWREQGDHSLKRQSKSQHAHEIQHPEDEEPRMSEPSETI